MIQTYDNYNDPNIKEFPNQNSLPEKLAKQHGISPEIAADRLAKNGASQIQTVLNLGDLIDGKSAKTKKPFMSNPRIKILNFDTYDVSVIGRPENHKNWKLADQILTRYNPNY